MENIQRMDPSGQKMVEFIQRICDEVGPRLGGSKEEQKAGDIIHDEFNTFCDEVEQEEFTCHPQGFLDSVRITALLYIAGVVVYFFIHPLLSSFLIISALTIYFIQINLLYEVVDFLFPKKTSFHVIGKIKPKQDPHNLVLLSGHHDSAYEFPLLSKFGTKSSYLIIIAVVISILNILLGLVKTLLITTGDFSQSSDPFSYIRDMQQFTVLDTIDWLQLTLFSIGTVLIMILVFFLRSNKVVLGANDNLTGVAAVLECGRYLAMNKPETTEVWLVSFAGEEHMRGSKRFVSKHFKELHERQALLLNLESLNAESYLLATAEFLYLAKLSPLVVEKVAQAAKKVNVPVKVEPMRFAGSDAANFTRKGLHATTLFGLSQNGMPIGWHSLKDTPDMLSGLNIARAAEIALQFVYDIDRLD